MILLDTSGLLAAIDASQRDHTQARTALSRSRVGILSPLVLAELDYLLLTRVGPSAELALLTDVARGAYRLEPFAGTDIAAAQEIIAQYADLGLGLADASVVVLAHRYGIADILTLDVRHFRVLSGPRGQPFRLLPADAG